MVLSMKRFSVCATSLVPLLSFSSLPINFAFSAVRAKVEAEAKKKTITCIKGKLIKKVTGTNPKCPVGYKLKK